MPKADSAFWQRLPGACRPRLAADAARTAWRAIPAQRFSKSQCMNSFISMLDMPHYDRRGRLLRLVRPHHALLGRRGCVRVRCSERPSWGPSSRNVPVKAVSGGRCMAHVRKASREHGLYCVSRAPGLVHRQKIGNRSSLRIVVPVTLWRVF